MTPSMNPTDPLARQLAADASDASDDGDGRTSAAMAGLRAALAERADREQLVDVAFRTVDSPAGELLLATTDEGLVKVSFGAGDDVLAELARHVGPRVLRLPARLDDVARQLDEYFAGRRRDFDMALDLRLAHGFRRKVLDELRTVSYGRTVSYAQLAVSSGSARAVRAVGSACATNPIPIVIPCHRVLRSDGNIGNYGGGSAVKRALLDLEAGRAA